LAHSKVDVLDEEMVEVQAKILEKACGQTPLRVSAVTGEGVKPALGLMLKELGQIAAEAALDEDDSDTWSPLG